MNIVATFVGKLRQTMNEHVCTDDSDRQIIEDVRGVIAAFDEALAYALNNKSSLDEVAWGLKLRNNMINGMLKNGGDAQIASLILDVEADIRLIDDELSRRASSIRHTKDT